jgi:hypothetical protein
MKYRSILIPVTVLVIVALALAGGVWSVAAGTTPTTPTIPPKPGKTTEDGEKPVEAAKAVCTYGDLNPDKELDLNLGSSSGARVVWGGAFNPSGTASEKSVEMICRVPAELIPARYKFHFQRSALEVRQFVKGQPSKVDSKAPKTIYFDLTADEKAAYDKVKDNFGMYWYNPETYAWEACPNASFDGQASPNGRVSCGSVKWGVFAMGWPVKK